MDITDTFRSYVNRVKLRRDLIGIDKVPLKFKVKRDEFNSKSKDVVYHISKLRDCLLNHKEQYMNVNRSTWLGSSMDDSQREKIDSAARSIIKNCSSLLKELAAFVENNSVPSQLHQHRNGVLELVTNYLKNVCKLYADMRECYAKRHSEYSSMMKVALSASNKDELSPQQKQRHQQAKSEESRTSGDQETDEGVTTNASSVIEELTEEELQMFEVENEDLINELNNLKGEVKAIEMNVTRIAGLQGTFAEMVLQQDLDIQRIDTKLIGATENVQDANLELRKAVQNNASFRFYLLFFILMLSFTLLFLNWYND